MRWKSFTVGIAALLAAVALPLTAVAATGQAPRHARLHQVDRALHRADRTIRRADREVHRAIRTHRTVTGVHWFAGSVAAASSSSVSVNVLWTGTHDTQLDGKTVSVAIGSSTQIVLGKGQTGIDPGDLVGVRATATDSTLTTLTATRIHVNCNCHWIGGTVGSVGGTSIVVHAVRTGPYDRVLNGHDVTLQVNSSTIYIKGTSKTPITLGDLKAGDRVGVVFAASGFFRDPNFDPETATFTAKRVHQWPGKATPSASTDADAAAGLNP